LWQHSIAVAITAQRLSEYVAYPAPDEAYMAGLLHDIGKLVMDQYFEMNWEHLVAAGQAHNLTLVEAEEWFLSMNHAQVGAELASRWGLPSCLVEAIAYHHQPALAKETPKLTAIVHIANAICLRLGIGLPGSHFLTVPNRAILNLLSLQPEEIDMLTERYKDMLLNNMETTDELMSAPIH
jgi:putative nucleotidyltransferase with HDIG domain